jgi:hypothetical protein
MQEAVLSVSPVAALGGTAPTGSFFRGLRKLYSAACGETVGHVGYGMALGRALDCAPFTGEQIAEFDRGYCVTPRVLYGALLLASEGFRP